MTILMSLFFVVAIFNQAKAQQKTPEEKAKIQTDKLVTSLNLTKVQTDKVHAIALKYAEKIENVRLNNSLIAEERQDQIKDLREEREQELKTVLTPEQFEKYKELKPQWKKENREQRKLEQLKKMK